LLLGYARLMLERGATGVPEAMRALDRALALDPDAPDALETKATLLFRSGRVEEARPLFTHAGAVAPATGASHVALAVLALREGRDAEAIAELESARRIAPGDPWILDHLHDAYSKSGDATHADEVERARKYFVAKEGRTVTGATRWLPEGWR
jgi:predicted Zn-dependent protease